MSLVKEEKGKFYFTPSNMIVSVVSYASQNKISELFSTFAKTVPSGEISRVARQKEFNIITKQEKIEIDGGGEQAHLYYGFQKTIDEADVAALKVLSLLLSEKIIFDICI